MTKIIIKVLINTHSITPILGCGYARREINSNIGKYYSYVTIYGETSHLQFQDQLAQLVCKEALPAGGQHYDMLSIHCPRESVCI